MSSPAGPTRQDLPPRSPGPRRGEPSPAQLRRWRRNLADEQAEAAVYRHLAQRREGQEREILLALAEAETRHEQHWRDLLGEHAGRPKRGGWRTRALALLARVFGSVFVLALAQRAEARASRAKDADATDAMAADERVHGEVVRALATRGRERLSGSFRAAVFGANDGLVSNLALVLGVGATGISPGAVLFTGVAGLLSGALSMGAGEYVSVRSQRELLAASTPDPHAHQVIPALDVDANELALLYRARGMDPQQAAAHAADVIAQVAGGQQPSEPAPKPYEEIGQAWSAALSSFGFFALGALVPIIPYAFGLAGLTAVGTAAALVGVALLVTGGIVGVLSGSSPVSRALRQLGIGYGAATITYALGRLVGAGLI